MPILVQWKWEEGTKTFLVIFHFYDDYSQPNIRLNNKTIKDGESEFERPTITWAPSHLESGLLSELLGYANIINGLKEGGKRELRRDLEVAVKGEDGNLRLYAYPIKNLLESQNKILLFETPDSCLFIRHMDWIDESTEPEMHLEGYDKKIKGRDWFFCAELSSEYIRYLKRALTPYLK